MGTQIRCERVANAIQKEISEILKYRLRDERLQNQFASVTRVTVNKDLKSAKIYLSVYGEAEDKTAFMQGLKAAQGYIRTELGKRLQLRCVPELKFILDASIEEGSRILELIDKLKEQGQLGSDSSDCS